MIKVMKKNPEVIPASSLFAKTSLSEIEVILMDSELELNDLTVLSLFSIFEQEVLDYIKQLIENNLHPLNDQFPSLTPYLLKQAETGKFEMILDLFKERINIDHIGKIKQIYQYRNWVAHGKQDGRKKANVLPKTAFYELSSFLQHLI